MLLPRLLGFAERAWAKDPAWATIADTSQGRLLYAEAWSSFLNVVGEKRTADAGLLFRRIWISDSETRYDA